MHRAAYRGAIVKARRMSTLARPPEPACFGRPFFSPRFEGLDEELFEAGIKGSSPTASRAAKRLAEDYFALMSGIELPAALSFERWPGNVQAMVVCAVDWNRWNESLSALEFTGYRILGTGATGAKDERDNFCPYGGLARRTLLGQWVPVAPARNCKSLRAKLVAAVERFNTSAAATPAAILIGETVCC